MDIDYREIRGAERHYERFSVTDEQIATDPTFSELPTPIAKGEINALKGLDLRGHWDYDQPYVIKKIERFGAHGYQDGDDPRALRILMEVTAETRTLDNGKLGSPFHFRDVFALWVYLEDDYDPEFSDFMDWNGGTPRIEGDRGSFDKLIAELRERYAPA